MFEMILTCCAKPTAFFLFIISCMQYTNAPIDKEISLQTIKPDSLHLKFCCSIFIVCKKLHFNANHDGEVSGHRLHCGLLWWILFNFTYNTLPYKNRLQQNPWKDKVAGADIVRSHYGDSFQQKTSREGRTTVFWFRSEVCKYMVAERH